MGLRDKTLKCLRRKLILPLLILIVFQIVLSSSLDHTSASGDVDEIPFPPPLAPPAPSGAILLSSSSSDSANDNFNPNANDHGRDDENVEHLPHPPPDPHPHPQPGLLLSPSFSSPAPPVTPWPSLVPTEKAPLITHETTYTYTTTRFVDGTESVTTRKETITNYEVDSIVRPTVPAIVTVTKSVRLKSPRLTHGRSLSGHSELLSRQFEYNLASNVPTVTATTTATHLSDTHEPPSLTPIAPPSLFGADPSPPPHPVTPTPVTYYTTFTYFTTELSEGHPVVRSREQVISTVIRGKVLPTRVGRRERQQQPVTRRPLEHRSKRSLVDGLTVALLDSPDDESHSLFTFQSNSSSSSVLSQSVTGTSTASLGLIPSAVYSASPASSASSPPSPNLISPNSLPAATSAAAASATKSPLVSPSPTPSSVANLNRVQATGLLSTLVFSKVNGETTTLYTKKVHGTFIGDLYAHYATTDTSTIIAPSKTQNIQQVHATSASGEVNHEESPPPSLQSSINSPSASLDLTPASVIHSTEVNSFGSTTVHTTEIYMTHISGFPAQFTRSTFNVIDDSIVSETPAVVSLSSKNYLHFPSPLRSRKQPQTVSPTATSVAVITTTEVVTTTVTATAIASLMQSGTSEAENKSKQPSYNLHTLIKSSNSSTSFNLDYSIDGDALNSGTGEGETGVDYPADPNEAEYEENESSFEEEKALPGHIPRHRASREDANTNSGPPYFDDEGNYGGSDASPAGFDNSRIGPGDHRSVSLPGRPGSPNSHTENAPRYSSSYSSSSSHAGAVFGQRVSASGRSQDKSRQIMHQQQGQHLHHQLQQSPHHSVRHPPGDPVSPVINTAVTSQRQGGRRVSSPSSRFQSGPGVILTKEEADPSSNIEIRTGTSQRQVPPNIGMSSARRTRIDAPSGDASVNGARASPASSSSSTSSSSSSSTSSSSQKHNRINGQSGNSRRGTYSRTGRNGSNGRSRASSPSLHVVNVNGDEDGDIQSGGIYPSNSNGNSNIYNSNNNNGNSNTNSHNKRMNNNGNNRRRGQSGRTVKTIILAPSSDFAMETRLLPNQLHLAATPTPNSPILPTWTPPPKSTLTVTSIATWVKTLPIRHGFKTSYATITTQGFNTSLIRPDQYQVTVDPTDTAKLITQVTQDATSVDAAGVQTKLIVTTTDLSEIKLVPIRVGYSTRTDTLTSSYVLTTLKTIYSTPPLPPAYTLLTATVSTTATITSTSVSSLVLAGKTLLSTLTSTSLQETTIVTTKTIPLGGGFVGGAATLAPTTTMIKEVTPAATLPVVANVAGPLFTTLITFQITDDQGDITKLVTPVTLPVQAIVHKVASRAAKQEAIDVEEGRKIEATLASSFFHSSSSSLDHTLAHPDLIPLPPNDPYHHHPHEKDPYPVSGKISSTNLLPVSPSSPCNPKPLAAAVAVVDAGDANVDAAVVANFDTVNVAHDDLHLHEVSKMSAPSKWQTAAAFASHVPILSASFSTNNNEQTMSNVPSSHHLFKGSSRDFHHKKSATLIKPVKHKKASKEDKYVTGSFKQRRLQQFNGGDDFGFGLAPQTPNAETFFRDFGRVVPLPQSFPSPSDVNGDSPVEVPDFDSGAQSSPPNANFGGRQPTFQRLKVTPGNNPFTRLPVQSGPPPPPAPPTNGPGQLPPFPGGFAPAGDNSPFTRFHRIVANKPEIPLRTTTNFRRVPVFGNQLPPSIPALNSPFAATASPVANAITSPPQVPSPPPNPSVQPQSIPIPSLDASGGGSSNKPFRRVRPNQGNNGQPSNGNQVRRARPTAGVRVQTDSSITSGELVTTNVPPVTTFKSLLTENEAVTEVPTTTPAAASSPVTPDSRRLVRIRRPPNSAPGSRRRVVVRPHTSSTIRVPINNEPIDEDKLSNAVDVESDLVGSVFGSRVITKDETPASPNLPIGPSVGPVASSILKASKGAASTIPLTYLTTYTYLTTVLRGPHTLVTSRLSTESSVSTQVLEDGGDITLARILPSKTVNIATRTKGPTTTIVNVQSEVRATYVTQGNQRIQPSASVPVSSVIRPTALHSIHHRKPVIEAPVTPENNPQTIPLDHLEKVPKTYFTKYTYFYTVVDGSATRRSTRSEVVSSRADSPINFAELKIKPTVSNGLVSIGSGPETVHLGRRSFGKSTTEVNLAMETYLQLEGITNAVIESVATAVPNSPHEATTSLPDSSVILGSLGQDESTTVHPTPDIPSRATARISSRVRGSIIRSSPVHSSAIRSDLLRSKAIVSSRPGLRVRVRQSSRVVASSPSLVTPSFDLTEPLASSPVFLEPSASLSPESSSSDIFGDLVSPTPVLDLEASSSDLLDGSSRRRVAVTVRRPFGGLNRLRTRTRSGVRDQTVSPLENGLASETTSTKESLAPTRVPSNRLKVASRVFRPHLHQSISLNPNEHPEPPIEPTSSLTEGSAVTSSETPILPSGSLLNPSHSVQGNPAGDSGSDSSPSTVVITYFTTTTHTVPFTVGDKTLYTTFEMTNTRIATETIDPSVGLRAVSPSASNSESPISILASNTDQPLETKTMFTTFTFFTTFFTGDSSTVKSSEKVISNIVAVPVTSSPVLPSITPSSAWPGGVGASSLYPSSSSLPEYTSSPVYTPSPSFGGASHSPASSQEQAVIVTETTEKIDVSTIYSTQTFYATLYNGNTSTITPIEETKTEVLTLREPVKVTRTIWPDGQGTSIAASSTFSKTYFTTLTSLLTLVSDNQVVTTPVEQVTSSVITFTIAASPTKQFEYSSSTVTPVLVDGHNNNNNNNPHQPKFTQDPSLLTTRTTHTTLTHYITLYSGTNTVLSSVTEISPTVVTEAVAFTPYKESHVTAPHGHISRTHDASGVANNLLTSFSPSISTLLTTHTYFTTLFSGTTSFVSSRADVTSSLVTLYVPASAVTPTGSIFPSSATPTTTVAASSVSPSSIEINPSLISHGASSGNEKVLDDLRSQILSIASPANTITPSSIDTSPSDQTALFTRQQLPPSHPGSSKANTAAGPPSDAGSSGYSSQTGGPLASPGAGMTSPSDAPVDTTLKPSSEPDSVTESTDLTSKSTPGSVVDLEDILSGSGKINGNLGAAIKDIVSLFAAKDGNSNSNSNPKSPNGPEDTGKTPQPVYVPPQNERTTESVVTIPNEPDLEPVFRPESSIGDASLISAHSSPSSIESSRATGKLQSKMQPSSSVPTPSLPTTRLMDSTSKAVFSQVGAGATTIFFGDADAGVTPTMHISGSVQPTRYVTSVESLTRTLTLTTTKVYYTRDSPLTITSVLTTVIPPKTFVSTIIGSRTILGTAGEATRTQATGIQATETVPEATTTITTTTLIFNSITTTVVRTLVIPNEIQATKAVERTLVTRTPGSAKPTRKPLVSVRTTAKTTPPPVAIKPAADSNNKKRKPLPKPVVPVELETPISRGSSKPITKVTNSTELIKSASSKVPKTPVVEDDQCSPGCNTANKEICVEDNGKYKCDCRPGYSRKDGSSQCRETNNFVLLLRVMKLGESEVNYNKDLSNVNSGEYKKLAKMTTEEINKVYSASEGLKQNYLGVDVTRIGKNLDDDEGVLVNLTVRVMHDEKINEDLLREELTKNLEEAESLPVPAMISAEVEDVMDLDECSDPQYNDCSPAAKCINEPGSYTCRCKGIFTDLDPVNPGRSCASEVKMCDLCNGRGDCYRDETGDVTACKCHRMYIGRYCEINGILLATLLPVAAILSIISVCCIVYCCRKYRKRTTISKGFRNIAQFGPPTIGAGTLDRKAMLGQETSSENSDHYRGHHHSAYEGPGHHASMDPDSSDSTPRRRRGSEPNIDRLPGQANATGYPPNLPPQVVIPRARHPNQPGASDEIVPVPAPGKYRRSSSRSDLLVCENPSLEMPPPQTAPSVTGKMSIVPPPPPPVAVASSSKKVQQQRWPGPSDQISVKSKTSRINYPPSNDLMNFWSPPDETMSMHSRTASAIVPQSSHKKRILSSKNAPWEWQNGHPGERESRRGPSPVASYIPSGNIVSQRDIRGPMSEAARSFNESIQFAPTKSRPPRFAADSAEMRLGYGKGWRGNMIPERAESEVSYTTSFLTSGHRFPYPLPEDGVSVVSRRSYFSNANWGTLPFGEED